MLYRRLGSSGLQVSALSLGAWVTMGSQIDEDVSYECMAAAYEAGVNFFDNAEAYGSGNAEVVMGNVIQRAGWKRSDLVISTKIFWGGKGVNDRGLSHKHVLEGTWAALKRLQMDYVDLLFCHRPDPETPIEETVRAMTYLINQGLVFYWGTSEWSAEQIWQAHMIARREHLAPPTMEQPEYNMLHRTRVEKEYAALYDQVGLGTTIWSPLASGILTGKYNDGIPQDSRFGLANMSWLQKTIEGPEGQAKLEKVRKLKQIADELNCTQSQLALAWCLANPHVSTVITGASRKAQVVENMRALDVLPKLTADVLERIESVLQNNPVPDRNWRKM
jgi:voltage-dependent potassium channel beta subunit